MALLKSRHRILYLILAGTALLVALAYLVWRSARPGLDPGSPSSTDLTPPRKVPRPSPLADRRTGPDRTPNEPTAAEPDPSWDAETTALWRTLQDVTQDDIVREAAALKLASRGDRTILTKLWELWRQGRLPAGCSWINDLMASETADEGGLPSIVADQPALPPAEIAKAMARVANEALPLEARLEALRTLASARSQQALSLFQDMITGAQAAPAELRTAAFAALLNADEHLAVQALGQRLAQPEPLAPTELLEMLEALGDEPHPGAREIALPLLQHPDPEAREEAAWLLAVNSEETTAEDMRAILAALAAETEPAARRRQYAALNERASPYAEGILDAARAEDSVAVRLSGYQAIAAMAAAEPGGRVGTLFDNQVVAELTDTALNGPDYQYRFEAVVVLKSARTAGATAALARIAAEASDQNIARAAAVP